MKLRWLFILLSAVLLFGCIGNTDRSPLGFKTTDECDDLHTRAAPRMQCYHTAAITAAYLGDHITARSICRDIWFEFSGSSTDDNDIRRRAELAYNTCFYDIAKIISRTDPANGPSLCSNIRQWDNLGTGLVGSEVTQDMCYQESESIAQIAPQNFFSNNPNSICTMVLVLPLLLVFTQYRRVHP